MYSNHELMKHLGRERDRNRLAEAEGHRLAQGDDVQGKLVVRMRALLLRLFRRQPRPSAVKRTSADKRGYA